MQSEDFAHLHALEENFWWFEGMRAVTAALLDPLCPPTAARVILDAGCGTGGNLAWLARYAGRGRIVGIDVEDAALQFCRTRAHKDLTQASVTALPFAEATFDLVTSFDVLVQLPGAGADELAISEMYRVLKPGGIIFVRVAAYEWMRSGHDQTLGTVRRYTLGELRRKMRAAGFAIKRATYANALLLPLAALRRRVLKPLGLVDSGSDVKPLPPQLRWLNSVLTRALQGEARLLQNSHTILPAGLSAICVAEKPRV